jgi:hypothetical protein
VDCLTKTVTIQGMGKKRVVFRGERRVVLNSTILVMMTEKVD